MEHNDIKKLIEDQGAAFDEFKRTHAEMLKAKADGKSVADLEQKLARIDDDMNKFSERKAELDAALARANRPAGSDKAEQDVEAEAKSFNAYRVAAGNGAFKGDVSVDEYVQYKQAFWSFARKGNINMLSGAEQKALTAGTDSEGGYLLPSPTVGRIVAKLYETSPMRQWASVQTISTDALEGLNDLDEASYGWVGEVGARTTTNTPTVGKYRIEAHEMYANPKASQKLLDDAAVDVESWLAMKVADKFARVENAAFFSGTGVGQPRGFTTYTTAATADASRTWGELEHVKTGANGDFNSTSPADYLIDLVMAFKTAKLAGARWLAPRSVISKVRKFKEATTNAYMWQPGLVAGQPDRLLGFPVEICQDMPTLATDSLSMALGNFADGYQIVDRVGIRTLRDPYTDKPYINFYSTKRVGGAVVDFEAIKFIKFSA
jgi:HK97 family phage major capsid protein